MCFVVEFRNASVLGLLDLRRRVLILSHVYSRHRPLHEEKETSLSQCASIAPLKYIEYRIYGDLIMICPEPCSIYLRETIPYSSN